MGVIAGAATAVMVGQAAAEMCARPAEQAALEARVLQTELMVAALSCGEAARYNAFIAKFQDQLVERGRTLRALFQRTHGAGGERRLDRFVTRLANEASQRSTTHGQAYCTRARRLMTRALDVEPQRLATFTAGRAFSASHGIAACAGEGERHAALSPRPHDAAEAPLP